MSRRDFLSLLCALPFMPRRENPVTQLHQREMVTPPELAAEIRRLAGRSGYRMTQVRLAGAP